MRVCAQFAKIMDLIEVNGGITRESVCVCIYVSACVCVTVRLISPQHIPV